MTSNLLHMHITIACWHLSHRVVLVSKESCRLWPVGLGLFWVRRLPHVVVGAHTYGSVDVGDSWAERFAIAYNVLWCALHRAVVHCVLNFTWFKSFQWDIYFRPELTNLLLRRPPTGILSSNYIGNILLIIIGWINIRNLASRTIDIRTLFWIQIFVTIYIS